MNWRVSECCCFSLRTGSLTLGYLGVIGNTITSLLIIFALPFLRKWIEEADHKSDTDWTPEKQEALIITAQVTLVIILIASLVSGLFSALLLIGVYKEKPRLLRIYIIMMVVSCTIMALYCVANLVGSFFNPKLFQSFIGNGIGFALNVYFTVVVNSYRLQLLEGGGIKRNVPNVPRQF